MRHLSLLIGAVFAVLSAHQSVEALRYPPGLNGGGYVAINLLGPTEVQSGDNFTYTAIVTNDSSSYARNMQVTYAIPDGLRWRDRFSHPSCDQSINTIICTYDLVAPGSQSVQLHFTTDRLIYTNDIFCPRTISSVARVSTGSPDGFSGDNTSPTLSTRITCYDPPNRYRQGVDLQLTLASPQSIVVGEPLTISAVVTNAGTENAMFITVLLSIPSGLSPRDLPRFCQITGSMITCTNFTLRSGESRVLTFTIPLPSALSCPLSLEWRGQVYSGSQNSYSNVYRTSSAYTSIACQPVPTPPLIPNPTPHNQGGNTGGSTPPLHHQSYGGSNNAGEWVWHGPYRDVLGVCDLPLDIIFPCPTGGYSTGGGYSGGTGGGGSSGDGGTGGWSGGGIGGSSGGSGGFFGGENGGGTSGDGGSGGSSSGGDTDTSNKKSIDETYATFLWHGEWVWDGTQWIWTGNRPPDTSGQWTWIGQGWSQVGQESTVAMIDAEHWTVQYCNGTERATITYTIKTTNQFDTPINNIDIVEMLNPTAICIKKSSGGLIGPRHILWQIDTLKPHSTHTIQYTVGILPHVPDQFVIANLTHAGTIGPHILTRDFEMVEVSRTMH